MLEQAREWLSSANRCKDGCLGSRSDSCTVRSHVGHGLYHQGDLTKVGTYVMMGPIGLVIAMVVSLFINSGALDMPIGLVGF